MFVGDEEMYVQPWAYEDCVFRYGQGYSADSDYEKVWEVSPRHDYMALIDVDEFIVLQ